MLIVFLNIKGVIMDNWIADGVTMNQLYSFKTTCFPEPHSFWNN